MQFVDFLKEIQPFVITVGSYARGSENEFSDIDFYIKRKPQDIIDKLWEETDEVEEYYMKEIIDITNKYNYIWSSVIFGHIAVEVQKNVPVMVELSYHYKIPKSAPITQRYIYGVQFDCAIDDKNCRFEDSIDWVE